MKKNIIKILALITAFLSLVACGEKQTKDANKINKEELVMAIGSEPDEGFDPCVGWGRYGSPLFQSTLVETAIGMEIVNDLAKDYEISDDGLVYTFNLREDVYFTDKENLTAEDVVFTFNEAKESGSIVDLTNMEKVEKTEDYQVKFTLNKADLSFLYTVSATGIVPKHLYDSNYGDNPVGSGPFVLSQWDKGQQIIIKANENYYRDVPEMKKVTILFMEEDTAFAALKAGELDVSYTSPNLANEEIENMTLNKIKTIDNRGITLPQIKDEGKVQENGFKLGNNVTSDISIRRALSYGIDRNELVENVINGFGVPAYTECDGMPWGNEEAIVEYDLDKANKILDDNGWNLGEDSFREKDGVKAEFKLLYAAGDSTRQSLATATSLQAKSLGINIIPEGTSWDIIEEEMFSEAILMGWGAQSPNETYLLYHSDNKGKDYYNPENYSNPSVDKHIDNAMAANNLEDSFDSWKKVQWDGKTGVSTQGDCPWVWLVNVDHLYYVRDGLNIGKQKIHPHGHAWPLLQNLKDWKWIN